MAELIRIPAHHTTENFRRFSMLLVRLPSGQECRAACPQTERPADFAACPLTCPRAPHAPQTSVLPSKLPKIPAWPLQPAHADHHSPTHALLNPWLAAAHAPHALYLHDLEKVLHKYSTRCIGFDPSSTFSKVLHFAWSMQHGHMCTWHGTWNIVCGTLYAAAGHGCHCWCCTPGVRPSSLKSQRLSSCNLSVNPKSVIPV